ncbi:hypothetical protein HYW76_05400 [Candidatus Pacearchaeota archaeon]|nr:hypothetical protein [Candidatus Pacearchaeota archaeon]
MTEEFTHKISKGSRYNQVYIPQSMKSIFEVGDLVKITLLRKKSELFYSKNLNSLNKFKKDAVIRIFSSLSNIKEIKQIFVFGSFLFKSDFKDIDVLLIANNQNKNLEEKAYSLLSEAFGLNFHIIFIPEKNFKELLKFCPLTRSMLYYSVSNKEFSLPKQEYNPEHINFLLMMPQDLLKLNISSSRAFYDNIRRLLAIICFLEYKELNPINIEKNLSKLLDNNIIIYQIKNNLPIDKSQVRKLKDIIRKMLNKIGKLKNEQKS